MSLAYFDPKTRAFLARYERDRETPFMYFWRIQSIPEGRTCETHFTVREIENTQWRIRLFFNNLNNPSSFWIERLQDDGGPDSIEIRFEISLQFFFSEPPTVRNSGIFRKNDRSKTYVFPKRAPNIFFEIKLLKYIVASVRCCIWKRKYDITHLDIGISSDVCLRTGGTSFPVHKSILSSRSRVFNAMFTLDMRERTSECIHIADMDSDTMNRLLLYIYKDIVQELTWESAAKLLEASDRFELLILKAKCSSFLRANISRSNFCRLLLLADMHNDVRLEKSVQRFMLDNAEIFNSDVWKVFKKNHDELAFKTTKRIVSRFCFTY